MSVVRTSRWWVKQLAQLSCLTVILAGCSIESGSLPHTKDGRGLDAQKAFPTGRLIDLTYAFDEQTLAWPGNAPFQWERTDWGKSETGAWYAAGKFSMAEHSGTHLDAPIHFAEGRQTLDAIPLDRLIAPAVVISVVAQVRDRPDYRLSVEDILKWESAHGPIPAGSILLLHTGWGSRWPHATDYFGTRTPNDPTSLHFPGYSADAAYWLIGKRQVLALGIDTASIDYGPSRDFPVHRIANQANVYGLENIANLEQLPPTGARIMALPMKIRGGTGGPVRIVAIVPEVTEQGRQP